MTEKLDIGLVKRASRQPKSGGLTYQEKVAMNLFWRQGVRVPVIAKVFGVARNTAYYNCLTGGGAYPEWSTAQEINEDIDRMGVNTAWETYVTDAMVRAVNAANKELVERKHAA